MAKFTLIYYSRTGNINRVNQLLESPKIDVNAQNRDNNTALIYASRHGYSDIVQRLLECKAEGNIQGEDNSTALIWASRNRRIDVVQLLIQYQANYYLQDKYNMTALMWAYSIHCSNCLVKNERIIKMLKNYEETQIRESISSVDASLYADVIELIIKFIL